ncbi:MAG: PDZ domain-containing protein [Woeseiaceae bacterium]
MQKVSSAIVLSLIAGAAAAVLIIYNIPPSDATATTEVGNHFDDGAAIEERIAALENAVSEERQARQLLEEELLVLYAEIDRLENANDRGAADETRDSARQARATTQAMSVSQLREGSQGAEQPDRRNAMIAAGLSPERADHILRRESEMRFEMMQAYYDARNSGESFDRFSMSPDAMLRADIGDADYEKYLQANGRPTTVGVAGVMTASPAERAGLQPGDEIVGYDGDRVFSTSDLMQRTMAAGEGDVVVDVVRDGAPMQVVLPRGPIGVETGRFRSR